MCELKKVKYFLLLKKEEMCWKINTDIFLWQKIQKDISTFVDIVSLKEIFLKKLFKSIQKEKYNPIIYAIP